MLITAMRQELPSGPTDDIDVATRRAEHLILIQSAGNIISAEGRQLRIRRLDAVNGTPILSFAP